MKTITFREEFRILMLGDSISMQYRDVVKNNLTKNMQVFYPPENGRFAAYTFRMLYDWRKDLKWPDKMNLIYWNNGLWDVVRIFGDSPQTSIEEYERIIRRLYNRLTFLFPGVKIIFALTTPVYESKFEKDFSRRNRDIIEYNRIAENVITNMGGRVDNLYAIISTLPNMNEVFLDSTHFNEIGIRLIADHVTSVINHFCSA